MLFSYSESRNATKRAFPWVYLVLNLILFSNLFPFSFSKVLFFVPLLLSVYLYKISFEWVSISCLAGLTLIFVQDFMSKRGLVVKTNYLSPFFESFFPVHRWVTGYVVSTHDRDIAELINLLIFGNKNSHIYTDLKGFGILHLISISGFHFLLIDKFLSRFIKKRWIVIVVLILYWAAIDFSIPALRVILGFFVFSKNSLKKWALVSLFSLFFNVHIYKSLSFLLSYFFSLIFLVNRRLNDGRVRLCISNSWSAFIFATLVFLPFYPHRVYPLSIVNTFIFAPIISALFIYLWFTWFIPDFLNFHRLATDIVLSINEWFPLNASSFDLEHWSQELSNFLLVVLSLLFLVLHYRCLKFTTLRIRDC
ncbi:competence protein [Candidatus Mycoplasma haematohominis]|uniref:Competence protein n=1 Tax=Candidatus Mycoplasma haematohominis TaxID=1494318 RepID=A0A478FUU6_9MOLU|nr:competence protein [Candidatus Mycoplasma haemohominis]